MNKPSSKKKTKASNLTKKTLSSREKSSQENTDILSFFTPSPDKKKASLSVLDTNLLPETISVPSPNAAALPEQSLCKLCNGKTELVNSIEGCLCPSESQYNDFSIVNGSVTNNQEQKSAEKSKTKKHITKKKENRTKKTNHLVTEYFPFRRSVRKTLFDVKKEKQREITEAIISGIEDGFEIKEFPVKGRGVITTRSLKRGDFVLEYYGELISMEEAKKREIRYSVKADTGCYMYYFRHDNKQYCVDATKESGRLGRLVNHSKKGNLKTQSFFVDDSPHLILVASRDINPGEELLYDYGDRSKSSLESHPWLAL